MSPARHEATKKIEPSPGLVCSV